MKFTDEEIETLEVFFRILEERLQHLIETAPVQEDHRQAEFDNLKERVMYVLTHTDDMQLH